MWGVVRASRELMRRVSVHVERNPTVAPRMKGRASARRNMVGDFWG
jgi:hypothetical protein